MRATCYMCHNEKTSEEHVPPRCFFPKQKDTSDKDYRINLIKVPSCDKHNTDKSGIDEYLRQIIVMHHKSLVEPQSKVMKAVIRGYKKNPGKFINFMKSSEPALLNGEKTFTIGTDLEKFNLGMSHMAYGLYFYKYGKIWSKPFKIFTTEFHGDEPSLRTRKFGLASNFDQILSVTTFEGENPDVFKYRYYVEEEISMALFHLVFYEGFEVYAYS